MSHVTTIEKLGKDNFDSQNLQIKNDHWDYATGKEIKLDERTTEM